MANPPPYTGTPRWVKVFGIIALVLVLLFFVLHLTGHAPSHKSSAGFGGYTPATSVTTQGMQQP